MTHSLQFFLFATFSDESSVYYYVNKIHGKTSQWLHCVHMKAGIPYATLVIILFLSLIMMAWICCSTCDDDDDEDSRTEKVSF